MELSLYKQKNLANTGANTKPLYKSEKPSTEALDPEAPSFPQQTSV